MIKINIILILLIMGCAKTNMKGINYCRQFEGEYNLKEKINPGHYTPYNFNIDSSDTNTFFFSIDSNGNGSFGFDSTYFPYDFSISCSSDELRAKHIKVRSIIISNGWNRRKIHLEKKDDVSFVLRYNYFAYGFLLIFPFASYDSEYKTIAKQKDENTSPTK